MTQYPSKIYVVQVQACFSSTDSDSLLSEMHTLSTLPEDFQGKGTIYPNGVHWLRGLSNSEIARA